MDGELRRPILGFSEGVLPDLEENKACNKKLNNRMAWFGWGAPEADFGLLRRALQGLEEKMTP